MADKKFFVAVKALLCFEDRFLLIRRTNEARGDFYQWEFPGGRLEFGESPEQALQRELSEEVGIEIENEKLLQAWNFLKDDDTEVIGLTYMCRANNDEIFMSKEHDIYVWVKREEFENYQLVDGLMSQIKGYDWEYINGYFGIDCEVDK